MSYEPHPIRILIADQQGLFCRSIRVALGANRTTQVIGEASDGPSLLKLMRRLDPHVLLTDIAFVKHSGFEEALGDRTTTCRLVVMLNTLERSHIIEALRVGATGIVLKTALPVEFLQCINNVHSGNYAISNEAIKVMVKALREATPRIQNGTPTETYALTARELEIVERISAGLSNRAVCEEFSISERTVKHHLTKIYSKIGVTNRLALAMFAINNRLITAPAGFLNQPPPNLASEPSGFSNGSAQK